MIGMIFALGAGVATWSFLEYALHNWGGHLAKGKNEFSREHLRHHAEKDYFSPNYKKASMALPIVAGAALAAGWLVNPAWGLAYSLSFGLTYMGYEICHWRLHVYPPKGPWGRFLRKHHFYHHFHNPWKNHGVTAPLWDWVFQTYVDAQTTVIQIPKNYTLRWLMDEMGEIKPEYAGDYQLKTYGKKLLEAEEIQTVFKGQPA